MGSEQSFFKFGVLFALSATFVFSLLAYFSFSPSLTQASGTYAVTVVLTTTNAANQTWTVPSDWNSSDNSVEVIAAGGGGGGAISTATGSGGGAGAGGYSKSINITLTPGNTATYRLPPGGAGGGSSAAVAGGDAWFNGTTLAGSSVGAKGGGAGGAGTGGGSGTAGAGGLATGGIASGTGLAKYNGGGGAAGSTITRGGGGGGAGGPNGAGVAGSAGAGGQGGNGAGGAGGAAGSGPTAGSAGTEFQSSPAYGSGGGGGARNTSSGGGAAGGTYGAGGGGALATASGSTRTGGAGTQGLIVIKYNAPITVTITAPTSNGNACTGTPGAITITRNGPVTYQAVPVTLSFSGSAVSGTDYKPISTTVTILANEMATSVPVTAISKSVPEGTTVTLTASITASANYTVGGSGSVNMTIDNGSQIGAAVSSLSGYTPAPFVKYGLPIYSDPLSNNNGDTGSNVSAYPQPLQPWPLLDMVGNRLTNPPSTWYDGTPSPLTCYSTTQGSGQGECLYLGDKKGTRIAAITATPQISGLGGLSGGVDLVSIATTTACGEEVTRWQYVAPVSIVKVPKYTPVQVEYACQPSQDYLWRSRQQFCGLGCYTHDTLQQRIFRFADRAKVNGTNTSALKTTELKTISNVGTYTLQCGGYMPEQGTEVGLRPRMNAYGYTDTQIDDFSISGSGYRFAESRVDTLSTIAKLPPYYNLGSQDMFGGISHYFPWTWANYNVASTAYYHPPATLTVQACTGNDEIVLSDGVTCQACGAGKYRSGNSCVTNPPPTATINAGAGNGVPVSVVVGSPVTINATYTANPTVQTITKTIFLTTTSAANQNWPVPPDWNSSNNTVEVIASGGGGQSGDGVDSGGGGGGGGYSKKTNITLTPGGTATYRLSAGGAVDTTGGDAWFNGTTLAGSSVGAKGGEEGRSSIESAGGASALGIGSTKFSGGNGAPPSSGYYCGGAGGGAAGPHGAGGKGGTSSDSDGGGGGGNGGGLNGSNAGSSGIGGKGGNNFSGTGGGLTPAGNGSNGGGGAGSVTGANGTDAAGNGSNGLDWDSTHGSGGGGGGAGGTSGDDNGGAAGFYGAGGGGGAYYSGLGMPGAQGLIVITYAVNAADALAATAINDDATGNTVSCASVTPLNNPGCETKPDATKTYTFTPGSADAGKTFVFSAQIKTTLYPNYNGYATVQVNVTACPANSSGPLCTCDPHYSSQSGICMLDECTNNATFPGIQSSVPSGCTQNASDWTCTIPSNYAYNGTACIPVVPSLPTLDTNSFKATRVRAGNASTLSWSIPNMAAGITCDITLHSGLQSLMPAWVSGSPWTGSVQTTAINQATRYTLTCSNNQDPPASRSVIVNIIPSFQEI